MKVETSRSDDTLVVRLQEARLDAACAIQFKDLMRGLCAEATHRVVLDLSRVEFMDSSGLGAVVSVMKHLGDTRTLELAALSPKVAKVFRLTHMDRVFHIHATAADAFPCAEESP